MSSGASLRSVRAWAAMLVGAVMVSGWLLPSPIAATIEDPEQVVLVLFWGAGCPHCAAELDFLHDLQADRPNLVVEQYEVWYDESNRLLFQRYAQDHGVEVRGVPTTFVAGLVWVGFDETIAAEITGAVDQLLEGEAPEPGPESIVVPFLGEVDTGSLSVTVATVVIGLVDGFNPCSLWVLTLLLALVLHSGSRRRLLVVGLTFLAVTTMLYGAYVAALYNVLGLVAHSGWIRAAMALIALGFGVINVKDYFWMGIGPSLTIPGQRKPGIYRKMRAVAMSQRPLPMVLAGTAALAVGVSVIETPCTAGLPLLWVSVLDANAVSSAATVGLFLLYMSVFLLDELAVLAVAVVAMRVTKLEERQGRLLKLVSGWVMLLLAAVLLLAPDLMSSVGGAGLVLAGAAVLSVVTVGLARALGWGEGNPRRLHRPRRTMTGGGGTKRRSSVGHGAARRP